MNDQNEEIQRAQILRYMEERGSISNTKAVVDLGIARLASRIHEMKEAGMPIVDRWEYKYDNDGKIVKKWKEYSLNV